LRFPPQGRCFFRLSRRFDPLEARPESDATHRIRPAAIQVNLGALDIKCSRRVLFRVLLEQVRQGLAHQVFNGSIDVDGEAHRHVNAIDELLAHPRSR
jgi:hypothetical protein